MVVREEFYVDSMDRVHMIHGYRWYDPEQEWIGVLQIVHGMLEYIERYDEFAEKMAEAGYYVIGHDHLGHGDSVNSMEELGHLGEDGAVLWLKDMELVRRMAVGSRSESSLYYVGSQYGFVSGTPLSDLSWRADRWSGAYRNRAAAISYGEAGTSDRLGRKAAERRQGRKEPPLKPTDGQRICEKISGQCQNRKLDEQRSTGADSSIKG